MILLQTVDRALREAQPEPDAPAGAMRQTVPARRIFNVPYER